MMKKILMLVLVWLFLAGICAAQSVELKLDAGAKSINAGAKYRKDLGNGYMKAGIAALYTDDDETQYKWGVLSLVVGNDTMVQGLQCEVGLKGIMGDAETDDGSGDVGALAFSIHAGYLLSKNIMPIPLEFFTDITYAPELMSFRDTEEYTEASIGVGVHIIKNASLTLTYTVYDVDMENGPGNWSLDENVIRAGVVMRF